MRISTFSILILGRFALLAVATNLLVIRNSDPIKRHYVWPKNRTDHDALSRTSASIGKVIGADPYAFRNLENELILWTINVTSSQATEIGKDPGVESIHQGIVTSRTQNAANSTFPMVDSTMDQKAKRTINYLSQPNPVLELKMISQPRSACIAIWPLTC